MITIAYINLVSIKLPSEQGVGLISIQVDESSFHYLLPLVQSQIRHLQERNLDTTHSDYQCYHQELEQATKINQKKFIAAQPDTQHGMLIISWKIPFAFHRVHIALVQPLSMTLLPLLAQFLGSGVFCEASQL